MVILGDTGGWERNVEESVQIEITGTDPEGDELGKGGAWRRLHLQQNV